VFVSARTGAGIGALRDAIAEFARQRAAARGVASPQAHPLQPHYSHVIERPQLGTRPRPAGPRRGKPGPARPRRALAQLQPQAERDVRAGRRGGGERTPPAAFLVADRRRRRRADRADRRRVAGERLLHRGRGPARRRAHLRPLLPETAPGLRWRMPWPIQAHEIVNLAQVRTVEVGYRNNVRTKVLRESLMLTDDENIVDLQFAVQYTGEGRADYSSTTATRRRRHADRRDRDARGDRQEPHGRVLYEGQEVSSPTAQATDAGRSSTLQAPAS
jgi:hypothetical protein